MTYLYFTPEHVQGEPHADVLGAVDRQPADDQALRLDDVGRGLHARRHVGAHVSDRGAALDGDEPIAFEIGIKARRIERVDEAGAGEIADHGAVLGRDRAEILGADHAAGAVHVLHQHARIAGDVPADVFGEQAAFDVGRPADGEVDQERQPLALVERLVGVGAADRRRETREQRAESDCEARPFLPRSRLARHRSACGRGSLNAAAPGLRWCSGASGAAPRAGNPCARGSSTNCPRRTRSPSRHSCS